MSYHLARRKKDATTQWLIQFYPHGWFVFARGYEGEDVEATRWLWVHPECPQGLFDRFRHPATAEGSLLWCTPITPDQMLRHLQRSKLTWRADYLTSYTPHPSWLAVMRHLLEKEELNDKSGSVEPAF